MLPPTPVPVSEIRTPKLCCNQRVPVRQPQPVEVRPLLARGLDVLPLVLTDGAGGGRMVALGVLRPAGRLDAFRHRSPPTRQSPTPPA
jgi:hypothetical protein